MNKIILLFFLVSFNFGFSQYGIIIDKDGYVNVRNSNDKTNNIIDRLDSGTIVYYFESEANWVNIDYTKNGKELNGYIYKDRIQLLTDFKNIPLKSLENQKAKFENEKIKVFITTDNFIKSKHKLIYLKNEQNVLTKIDDQKILGTDGNIPKKEYKSIDVEIDNLNVQLPDIALKNLFEPNVENVKINYDHKTDILYIQSMNGDGAGGYVVLWIVEKKKFKKRYETHGF